MKIKIKVKPNSKIEKIEKEGEEYLVWVKEKAVDGRANRRVSELLAKEFGVSVKDVRMITRRGRKKVVEISV